MRRQDASEKETIKKSSRTPALAFNHAMIYVRELAPALHFYADQLGFKVIEVYPQACARLQSAPGQGTIALHIIRAREDHAAERRYPAIF